MRQGNLIAAKVLPVNRIDAANTANVLPMVLLLCWAITTISAPLQQFSKK